MIKLSSPWLGWTFRTVPVAALIAHVATWVVLIVLQRRLLYSQDGGGSKFTNMHHHMRSQSDFMSLFGRLVLERCLAFYMVVLHLLACWSSLRMCWGTIQCILAVRWNSENRASISEPTGCERDDAVDLGMLH